MFAGLTLGLLSLDIVGLRIVAQGGETRERVFAKAIMPGGCTGCVGARRAGANARHVRVAND
jgi:hypothetical protein